MKQILIVLTFLIISLPVFGQFHTTVNIGEGAGGSGGMDSLKVAVLQYQEADGVDGVPIVPNVWKCLPVNTIINNEIGVSIVGDSAISIPAGKYLVEYKYESGNTTSRYMTRFYDLSGSSFLGYGLNGSDLRGGVLINLSSTSSIAFQYNTTTTSSRIQQASLPTGQPEIYGHMTIIQLQ